MKDWEYEDEIEEIKKHKYAIEILRSILTGILCALVTMLVLKSKL